MEEKEIMIQVDNVSKVYKLGEIGGTTLNETIQRFFAKIRHKEDPTRKIGAKNYNKGETFKALEGINLTIKKGERVAIIGHNGAGKSTLLKLICRITAPTTGEIGLNGRITSMLEVGTGFHPELTGRENIYLNGAILGMTKKEIDNIIEDIIDFSEVREFIDTPVKRYSSGMYVKLAFSVAAHLKSDIMIMDEVLAVGDMSFQNKCLSKMRNISKDEGRTVLYVSHNMNTIRKLCDRVVVLVQGKVLFDGDVEEGIGLYLGAKKNFKVFADLSNLIRDPEFSNHVVTMQSIRTRNGKMPICETGDMLNILLDLKSEKSIDGAQLRFVIKTLDGVPVTMLTTEDVFGLEKGKKETLSVEIDTLGIAPGKYLISPVFYEVNHLGHNVNLDGLKDIFLFEIMPKNGFNNQMLWQPKYWGNFYGKSLTVVKGEIYD